MKALSLRQPWAELVMQGKKTLELRNWAVSYRGPLAIHAGKTLPVWAFRSVLEAHGFRKAFLELPLGAVVATCTLVDCVRITLDNVPPAPEFDFGDYTTGRWAWYLSDVKPLAVPVPARGNLGLWEVNL